MSIILMSDEKSKRSIFFQKAAMELKKQVHIVPLNAKGILEVKRWSQQESKKIYIKIDPLTYATSEVNQLPVIISNYRHWLEELQTIPNVSFLNTPKVILETLDKIACKRKLTQRGISVTPFFEDKVTTISELRALAKKEKAYQLFIKTNWGSGAAGVVAYRQNPIKGEERIFTSLKYDHGALYNTKVLRQIIDSQEIEQILDTLLKQPTIVERWIPKATHNGLAYDLRVVWQFGKIEKMVARQSSGPITNLHLNNRALSVEQLKLSAELLEQIEKLCNDAMLLFPGLNVAGIDILISKDKKQARIIEINGQGDLIYADIYKGNSIYRHQIERMSVDGI